MPIKLTFLGIGTLVRRKKRERSSVISVKRPSISGALEVMVRPPLYASDAPRLVAFSATRTSVVRPCAGALLKEESRTKAWRLRLNVPFRENGPLSVWALKSMKISLNSRARAPSS